MKKQTAVEYLVDQLLPKALTAEQYYHIDKAKAMEKSQILDAYVYGSAYGTDTKQGFSAVNYFESTYGK